MVEKLFSKPVQEHSAAQDRIVVIGGSARTLDMLRIAAIRSDDVVLFVDCMDAPVKRFTDMFAIDVQRRRPVAADLDGTTAVLVATGAPETDNWVVHNARRRNLPVHVADRPLVSDFTLMELVERHPSTLGASGC
jgi:siroheme synthase (precorrin-2 oxidase/ferrochelatase)